MKLSRTITVAAAVFPLWAACIVGLNLWEELGLAGSHPDHESHMLMFVWAMTPYVGMALLAARFGWRHAGHAAVMLAGSIAIGMLGILAFHRGFLKEHALNGVAVVFGPVYQWIACFITLVVTAFVPQGDR